MNVLIAHFIYLQIARLIVAYCCLNDHLIIKNNHRDLNVLNQLIKKTVNTCSVLCRQLQSGHCT
jgi:hypothetical protein